jgi:hypothetical protein
MRFSIRDLLWATLVVAMGVCWWLENRKTTHLRKQVESLTAEVTFLRPLVSGLPGPSGPPR